MYESETYRKNLHDFFVEFTAVNKYKSRENDPCLYLRNIHTYIFPLGTIMFKPLSTACLWSYVFTASLIKTATPWSSARGRTAGKPLSSMCTGSVEGNRGSSFTSDRNKKIVDRAGSVVETHKKVMAKSARAQCPRQIVLTRLSTVALRDRGWRETGCGRGSFVVINGHPSLWRSRTKPKAQMMTRCRFLLQNGCSPKVKTHFAESSKNLEKCHYFDFIQIQEVILEITNTFSLFRNFL